MKKEVLWFNHWFSTAYRIIELIKEGADKDSIPVKIIGSNAKRDCVYSRVCDEFYLEPVFKDEDEYVNWCLSFCKQAGVTVFAPRRNLKAIVRRHEEFNKIGVTLMTHCDYDVIKMLDSKAATFDWFSKFNAVNIPEYHLCENAGMFKDVCRDIINRGNRACFKYDSDEGATSFRVIDDKVLTFESLNTGVGSKVSLDEAFEIIDSANGEFLKPLIVMPYLKGPELSVDCLNTDEGIIAIQRCKEGRVTVVREAYDDIKKVVECFVTATNYNSNFNMQFRYHEGVLYLLEVNTRMSGGTHISSMLGNNLPYLAFRKALKLLTKLNVCTDILKVSQIETPVIL